MMLTTHPENHSNLGNVFAGNGKTDLLLTLFGILQEMVETAGEGLVLQTLNRKHNKFSFRFLRFLRFGAADHGCKHLTHAAAAVDRQVLSLATQETQQRCGLFVSVIVGVQLRQSRVEEAAETKEI